MIETKIAVSDSIVTCIAVSYVCRTSVARLDDMTFRSFYYECVWNFRLIVCVSFSGIGYVLQ